MYHELRPPFMARYIRFIPTAWHKHISMRVEVYGVKGTKVSFQLVFSSTSFENPVCLFCLGG